MHTNNHLSVSTTTAGVAHEPAIQPAASPLQAKAGKAAEKFEAFFINDMLRQMRRNARQVGGEEGRDRTGDDMLELAHGMVADVLAGQHAFGVANLILRQVLPSLLGSDNEQPAFKSEASPVALNK